MSDAASTDRESPEVALRLYTLTVEMADRLSARRAGANNFFLAVQSSLTTLLAAFAVRSPPSSPPESDRFLLTLALLAGLVLALAWWLLLTSYRRLSRAKFTVINEIEARYFKVRPYSDEWSHLKKLRPITRNPLTHVANMRDRYAELGVVEQLVPFAFAILYALIVLRLWVQ